jgi:CrcB protein
MPAGGGRWAAGRDQAPVVAVVAAGGVIGALLRFQAGLWWPTVPGTFPVTTLLVNAAGGLAMGVLMVLITEVLTAHRLIRPFLGTGVLGGFTTFSTFSVDAVALVRGGHRAQAVGYLVGTPLAALAAVTIGIVVTRRALARRRPR